MNIMKFFKPISLLFVALVMVVSCVEDDDFNVPNTEPGDVQVDGTIVSISSVIGNLQQSGEDMFTFEDTNTFMEGYVISDDQGGNFFEELILQDSPANPTAGIRILIDVNPLFTKYNFGRKMYIKLDGLTVGTSNGVYALGILGGQRPEPIPFPSEAVHFIRTSEVADIVPLDVEITDFSDDFENLFVRINDVQFNRNLVVNNTTTYAAEGSDEFDGERLIESCNSAASTILSTSTFADFKSLNLPAGRGSITGVLQRDFFDDFYIMVVNTPEDVVMDDPNRCDPDFLECNGGNVGGSTTVFSQNFESITNVALLDGLGWTNVNTTGGSTRYGTELFSGNRSVRISAFNTNEDPMEAWLITPAIDMDNTTDEALTFDVQASFDRGVLLEVLVSDDFAGDPLTATWTVVDANIPTGPSGGFGTFTNVGTIDVSCLNGNVFLAFKYRGGDASDLTTTYNIDNISITGN